MMEGSISLCWEAMAASGMAAHFTFLKTMSPQIMVVRAVGITPLKHEVDDSGELVHF